MFVQANWSRMTCVSSCGSVTVWTRWDRFGLLVAGIRWTVTTAAARMGSSSAPIIAARPPACGAPGPAGRRAAFPVERAREPDTGENQSVMALLFTNYKSSVWEMSSFVLIDIQHVKPCIQMSYFAGLWGIRSLIPETEGTDCQFEEVQHRSCDPGPCPPLCLHDNQELSVGATWLQGECKQWWDGWTPTQRRVACWWKTLQLRI